MPVHSGIRVDLEEPVCTHLAPRELALPAAAKLKLSHLAQAGAGHGP